MGILDGYHTIVDDGRVFVAAVVAVALALLLVYGATIGNEDPLSLAVGTLVLAGWLVGLAISRYYPSKR